MARIINGNIYQVEEQKYRCFYGIHIRTAATLVGAFGVIIETIFALSILFSGLGWLYKLLSLLVIFLSLASCALIVYGDRKETAWAYLPYLSLTGLGLLFDAIIGLFALYIWIFMPNSIIRHFPGNEEEVHKDSIRLAIVCVILEIVGIWLWTIVYRAYMYMKNVVYTKPKFEVY
uniref:MARVEL domain-containing protein n=1 Tax=Acrobeloides nanus TaxID=290746 RepID=A0A914E0L1_9BILA